MGIDPKDYVMMKARTEHNRAKSDHVEACAGEPVTRESILHEQVAEYCKGRGWPFIHSRMDSKTTTAKGIADYVIFASGGRVFNIELKTAVGKLSTDQLGWKMMLEMNGHSYFVCRSFEDFLTAIK